MAEWGNKASLSTPPFKTERIAKAPFSLTLALLTLVTLLQWEAWTQVTLSFSYTSTQWAGIWARPVSSHLRSSALIMPFSRSTAPPD